MIAGALSLVGCLGLQACDQAGQTESGSQEALTKPGGLAPIGSGNPSGGLFGDIDFDAILRAREAAAALEADEAKRRGLPSESALTWQGYNRSDQPFVTRHQALTVNDERSETFFQREHSDSFGNNRFGAGYDVKVHATGYRDSWTANTQLRGYANTWARVWSPSFTKPIFTVDAVANTINNPGSQWAGIWYKVMVFGNSVREETIGGGAYNTEKKLVDRTQQVTPEVKATFYPWGIPVTVGAYVRANEYIKLHGNIWIDTINATLTPGGSLWVNAYVQVGVDGVLNGSVKGMLKLIDVSVPAYFWLGWTFGANQGGQCSLKADVWMGVNWNTRELDGNIAACGEIIGWEKCISVASWNGFMQSRNLFNLGGSRQFGVGTCLYPTAPPTKS
jgi:hypothetical protein